MKKTSRRKFLAVSGKAVSATILGSFLLDADLARGAVPIVRRNVAGMDANDPIAALGSLPEASRSTPVMLIDPARHCQQIVFPDTTGETPARQPPKRRRYASFATQLLLIKSRLPRQSTRRW